MTHEDDAVNADRLGRMLRDSEELDVVSRSKLSAVRARVLEASRSQEVQGPNRWWLGLGGAVAAVVMMSVILPRVGILDKDERERSFEQARLAAQPQPEILELLAEDDPILQSDLYEDLEFMTWLAQEEEDERA